MLDTGLIIKENCHCVGPTVKAILIKIWSQNFYSFCRPNVQVFLLLRWRTETSHLHQMSCFNFFNM